MAYIKFVIGSRDLISQRTKIMKLNFGKYSGRDVADVAASDPDYIIWVNRNAMDGRSAELAAAVQQAAAKIGLARLSQPGHIPAWEVLEYVSENEQRRAALDLLAAKYERHGGDRSDVLGITAENASAVLEAAEAALDDHPRGDAFERANLLANVAEWFGDTDELRGTALTCGPANAGANAAAMELLKNLAGVA